MPALIALLILTLTLTAGASAQSLHQGVWSGFIKLKEHSKIGVSFIVEEDGRIEMVMDDSKHPLTDIEVTQRELSGSLEFHGNSYPCVLTSDNRGAFEGRCGEHIRLVMIPPEPAPVSNDQAEAAEDDSSGDGESEEAERGQKDDRGKKEEKKEGKRPPPA